MLNNISKFKQLIRCGANTWTNVWMLPLYHARLLWKKKVGALLLFHWTLTTTLWGIIVTISVSKIKETEAQSGYELTQGHTATKWYKQSLTWRIVGYTRNVYPENENSRILFKDGSLAPMTFKAADTFQIYSKINQICCVYDSCPSSYMYIWIHLTNDVFTDGIPGTLLCTENLGLNKTDKVHCLRNLALLFCIFLFYPLPSYVFHLLLNSISPKNSLSSTPRIFNNRFTAPPT